MNYDYLNIKPVGYKLDSLDISKMSFSKYEGYTLYAEDIVYDVTDVYKVIQKSEGFIPARVYRQEEKPHRYTFVYDHNLRVFFEEKKDAFDFIDRVMLNEL